ncbi:MAG TPA: AAA family ATPase [Candidatus Ozemobacteraceae bacterium]|mgnify:CR=1 FL=1|nr:AAA family ATPase [Candidatus Ozemobacteraceae bacterium]
MLSTLDTFTNTRIEHVEVRNFRCFDHLSVAFHKRLTVLVAPNGGGKTALLDLLALSLRPYLDNLQLKITKRIFRRQDVRQVLGPAGTMESVPQIFVQSKGLFSKHEVRWALSSARGATTSLKGANDLQVAANTLFGQHLRSLGGEPAPVFPLFGYYGTGRLWAHRRQASAPKARAQKPLDRPSGYDDCLSPDSRYEAFVDWFDRYSHEAAKEHMTNDPSLHHPKDRLSAITQAVDLALEPSGWKNMEWDFTLKTIFARHQRLGRLPVSSLSDGIRNMIGLVADIAHRAVRLNPQFGADAARRTPGIVLIDEVDMHLHPEWQQGVVSSLLNAFPEIQFIVTTHSPQVLTSLPKTVIRILAQNNEGAWCADMPEISPLAQESGDALAFIMNTHPRPGMPEIEADLHAYEILARQGKSSSPEALAIKAKLEAAGYEFSQAQRALFDFLTGRNRGGGHGNG